MAVISKIISFYNFESNSNDSVGGNNGSDTSIAYTTGLIGNAAEYDAAGDKISLGDPANLKFSGANACWAWINMASVNRANLDMVIFKGNDGGDFWNEAIYFTGTNTVKARINANRNVNAAIDTANYTFTVDSNWHLVILNYTGSSLELYWDDMVTPKVTASTSITIDTTGTWHIGNTNGSRSVSKKLDLVGFANAALTQAEREELYNSGAGFNPFTVNPSRNFFRMSNHLL